MQTTVNERLRQFLFDNKISNVDIAAKLNLSKQQVTNWLSMGTQIPDKHVIRIIELYKNIDARWLLTGETTTIKSVNNQKGDYNTSVSIDGSDNKFLNDSMNVYKDKEIKRLEGIIDDLKRDKEFLQQLLNNIQK